MQVMISCADSTGLATGVGIVRRIQSALSSKILAGVDILCSITEETTLQFILYVAKKNYC